MYKDVDMELKANIQKSIYFYNNPSFWFKIVLKVHFHIFKNTKNWLLNIFAVYAKKYDVQCTSKKNQCKMSRH